MCTAVSFIPAGHYFGRNLDLECSLGESVVVTPRQFPLPFRRMGTLHRHHAFIGVGVVRDGYPLCFDAVNEHGLGMAGLHFPDNAAYFPPQEGQDNIASFELIPWILSQCRSVREARPLLSRLRLTDDPFSPQFPLTPLHWMLSDASQSLVVEQTQDGLHVYDNPIRVLTNNPPFPWHETNLANYMALTPREPECSFPVPLKRYSRAMGALGLPGDWSSASRFVRAAFVLHHSQCAPEEGACVNQFFRILGAATMPRGAVMLPGDVPDQTVYSVCYSQEGVCWYTTCGNPCPTQIDLRRENLDAAELTAYPMLRSWHALQQN